MLFDLDGTLRFNDPPYVQSFYDHAVRLGESDGKEKRHKAMRWTHYYWAQSPELVEDLRVFGDGREFWKNYALRSLLAFDCPMERSQELAPELERFMSEELHSEDYIPPDVMETLKTLAEGGLRLAVVSNRRKGYGDYLMEKGVGGYFELALAAGDLSAWKPEPQLFYSALEQMQLPAESVVYVGDNYYADVVGARQAGIQPILLDAVRLFPEADCPVVRGFGELKYLAGLK